ncbi:hypothetical protein PAAG_12442 [Paracoccidioides lutzii Pb01]|uniref:Uncharacterized protein n=1 Tax=Paracoccidioides lutzii (strain ATCC MYA-826 / Pb01) TaxID=502779 RepID=A0A0A2VJ08_PARBA|nr:hypothetical protein PAAG_12442 [Paracoccidioides lutzii Pb01]KGQ00899.1 hypothetical protein PAAG_12442 [Paracoccidioides lutzii Pb01]
MVLPVVSPYDGSGAASYVSWLLNYVPDIGVDFSVGAPKITEHMRKVHNPLFALGCLELNYTSLTNTKPISAAMECMFPCCLQRYDVSVKDDVPVSKVATVQQASMDKLSG